MTLLPTLLLIAAALVLLAAIGAWAWTLRASTRPCGGLTHDIADRHRAPRTVRYIDTATDREYVARRFKAIAAANTDVTERGRQLIRETS